MGNAQQVKVWDITVRIFHWALVVGFIIAYVSGEEEDLLHIYSGYIVFALILFRILWGFIGTRYARFWNFVYGPEATATYVKSIFSGKPIHYLGHNPIGGWMVILMLVSLFAVSWSGLELYASEGKGPLANADISLINHALANGDDDDERDEHDDDENEPEDDEFWEDIHEALAEITLFLVFAHIIGVLIASVIHKENLVRAMITGKKPYTGDTESDNSSD